MNRRIQLDSILANISKFFSIIFNTSLGRFLFAIVIFLLIFLLNILITGNNYYLFIKVVGIESIVALLLGWISYIIRIRRDKY